LKKETGLFVPTFLAVSRLSATQIPEAKLSEIRYAGFNASVHSALALSGIFLRWGRRKRLRITR